MSSFKFPRRIAMLIGIMLACGLFVGQSCSANDPPIRTWNDATGNYSVEASFVAVESGDVRMLKNDGTNILVPFKLLSSSDQNYVRSRLRARQAELRRKPLPVADLATRKGETSHPEAESLYGLNWYPTKSVSSVAQGKDPKPVMWFRVLGALDGFM